MELENSGGGGGGDNGGTGNPGPEADDVDSSCSTPYYSAPSSPSRIAHPGYYYSAPASPMHFVLSTFPVTSAYDSCDEFGGGQASCDFEFSARFTSPAGATAGGSMISADELFLNGQIRSMRLSTHLQRPQVLAPLLDLEEDYEGEVRKENEVLRGRESRLRSRSLHRRARSMSPLRTAPVQWTDDDDEGDGGKHERGGGHHKVGGEDLKETDEMQSAASSSRSNSSSSSRNGRRWVFLKDFLYRSKSEGRGNGKEKFWQSISFHQSKDKISSSTLFFSRDKSKDSSSASAASESKKQKQKQKNVQVTEGTAAKKAATTTTATSTSKPRNGVGKRRMPPCERHYTTNRAQAEEMRKRTFLPYRQGLLGCLGFSSRGYGAMNGLAKTLNPVSSR